MVASLILLGVSVGITGLFINNTQMSMRLRFRTTATNAALNILEQIRVLDYDNLKTLYDSSAPTAVTGSFIRVLIADPNAPDNTALAAPDPTATVPGFGAPSVPLKYQKLDLILNVRDGVVKNSTWNAPSPGLPLESSASAPRMSMRYWVTLKFNSDTVSSDTNITAKGEVLEIAMVYQWKPPKSPATSAWESGTVRAVVRNPKPKT